MCVVNSLVLADLGLEEAGTELPGGRVATDSGGRPTGLLEERAQPWSAAWSTRTRWPS